MFSEKISWTLGLMLLSVAALPCAAAEPSADAAQRALNAGDFAGALRQWLPLANAGDADAQLAVGALYDLGHGVSPDAAAAYRWYRRAAERGQPDAELNVAVMLDSGRGTGRDTAQAALWYARAAVRGNHRAQYNIASLYAAGEGVPRNPDAARAWFRIAASGGLSAASDRLRGLVSLPPTEGADEPVPATPDATVDPVLSTGNMQTSVELVWDAPLQSVPVAYCIEVVALDPESRREVALTYVDAPAALVALPPIPARYAWRVYSVGRETTHYAASAWSIFTVRAAGGQSGRIPDKPI